MEYAFALDNSDARLFLELDHLHKRLGVEQQARMEFFEKHMELVLMRDDLYLEYVTILNLLGEYKKAKELLEKRNFHPWEGGEGKVLAQYILAQTQLARQYMSACENQTALELLLAECGEYPHNLGEGKLAGAQENNIYYFLGCVYKRLGDMNKAMECYGKAAVGMSEPTGMMYYNDQPAEMIFYQGLALMELNRNEQAMNRFNKLIAYGEKHIFDQIKIDYFAVSLPDLMIFDDDLNKRNKLHCFFMMGLGYLGKGDKKNALEQFNAALVLDKNHTGIKTNID